MPLEPITGTVRGLDFTPRFVRSAVVVASPTDNTETIIASITLPDDASPVSGIELIAFAAFTIGTNGTAGNLRIRRTDASGTIVAATGGLTAGVWAATQLAELYVAGFDTGPTLPGQVYVATLTVTSGSAASTVSAVYLRSLTVQMEGYELAGEQHAGELPANLSSNVLGNALLVKGGPGYLFGFTVTSVAAQFVLIFDQAVPPVNGQVPVAVFAVPAGETIGANWIPPRTFRAGIAIANSSTSATLTLGSADCFFDVQYAQEGRAVPIISGGGGSGGSQPAVVLSNIIPGVPPDGSFVWNSAWSDSVFTTQLFALPSGLGFTVGIDGSGSGVITFTEAGVWIWMLSMVVPADPTLKFWVSSGFDLNGAGLVYGPNNNVGTSSFVSASLSGTMVLSAAGIGATGSIASQTLVAPTGTPAIQATMLIQRSA